VRLGAAAAAILLCAATVSAAPEKPKLDMLAFFTGKTRAENTLKVAFKSPVKLIVESIGGKGDRGDFVMIDTVHEGDKPVRQRKWVMRQMSPGHFGGTMTDASGPVDILVQGDGATIRYTMSGGLTVDQRLTLQADGRTLTSHVIARRLGLQFARVDGTVRKLD
jgi:hypothetical protein